MEKLQVALQRLDALANKLEAKNTAISEGSVGWHIAHCHLVVQGIVAALGASNPADYRWTFNKRRVLVLWIGKMPRGKAKAPGRVQPKQTVDPEVLQSATAKTTEALQTLKQLPPNAHFTHPFFGVLNKNQSLRVLLIHTKHHLAIIADILKVRS
ncbi:MAG: DUF1569 domain-containing protein [Bacteroidetes bacterium]|nr:MAG: DUF1569 domain-containing protein [Bacteroidota bacterium]